MTKRAVIDILYDKQKGHCYYCKIKLKHPNLNDDKPTSYTTSFDHKILKCNGGKRTVKNGVCACAGCNTARSDISFKQFKATVYSKESKQAFFDERNQVSKKAFRKKYPACTVRSKHKPLSTKKLNSSSSKHKRYMDSLRATYSRQRGKCCACNGYMLDLDRTYDDLTSNEYKKHPFKPTLSPFGIRCKSCATINRKPSMLNTIKQLFI